MGLNLIFAKCQPIKIFLLHVVIPSYTSSLPFSSLSGSTYLQKDALHRRCGQTGNCSVQSHRMDWMWSHIRGPPPLCLWCIYELIQNTCIALNFDLFLKQHRFSSQSNMGCCSQSHSSHQCPWPCASHSDAPALRVLLIIKSLGTTIRSQQFTNAMKLFTKRNTED